MSKERFAIDNAGHGRMSSGECGAADVIDLDRTAAAYLCEDVYKVEGRETSKRIVISLHSIYLVIHPT